MRYYAHSGRSADLDTDGELLSDHLRRVARAAVRLAVAAAPTDEHLSAAARAAGLLHDLGKYQPAWQAYLRAEVRSRGSGRSVPHAIHGAAHAFQVGHGPVALAVAGHHGGLADWHSLENGLAVGTKVPEEVLPELVTAARSDLAEFPLGLEMPAWFGEDGTEHRRDFWTRVLFSVLVDADRVETEKFDTGRARTPPRLDPATLLAKLDAHRAEKAKGRTDSLTALRNEVYAGCVAAGGRDRGFFALTVPTGGGKTLSAMAFALAHARRHHLRRVIVVIPYLSIIEQNAREYREVFGPEVVLEHHSAVADDGWKPPPGEPYRRSPAELAAENWDAPVVVTTSVQFLETLLAASTRRCRRLHNVAGSVILFDEAQCLPTHLLNPLLDVFRELVNRWGCSALFSTATQPAFRRSTLGLTCGLTDDDLKPVLGSGLEAKLFTDLQRVTYTDATAAPWAWDELVGRMAEGPALCVLNLRRHAREVWEKLRAGVHDRYGAEAAANVRHLSSSLCPEHRLAVLGRREDPAPGTLYHRLKAGKPCWLVSTQVVECGVDISFPRVFRALGPLDAIVQAAGRCNREGELGSRGGTVTVFRPVDDGMPPGLYQAAAGQAATLLGEVTSEQLATDPAVFARYFDALYKLADTDAAGIQDLRAEFKFASVAEAARVIADGGRSVIVPYTSATKWVARIRRKNRYSRVELRRLQRYSVSLRPNDFQAARQLGLVAPLLPGQDDGPMVLVDGSYHDELGVLIQGRPLGDFIQ